MDTSVVELALTSTSEFALTVPPRTRALDSWPDHRSSAPSCPAGDSLHPWEKQTGLGQARVVAPHQPRDTALMDKSPANWLLGGASVCKPGRMSHSQRDITIAADRHRVMMITPAAPLSRTQAPASSRGARRPSIPPIRS